jgi:drug/metabolite transporter (DMT)-like permease
VPIINWLAALAALGGTYLLSTGGQMIHPSTGDLLELAGAVIWAFHVIVVGLAVRRVNIYVFSVGQFLFCGVINLTLNQFISPFTWAAISPALPAILYGGIISVALGFTLQAVGQSKSPTADAVLILSLESVFGAIFGALILLERMNWIQILGCTIIMVAIVGAQAISVRKENQSQEPLKPAL